MRYAILSDIHIDFYIDKLDTMLPRGADTKEYDTVLPVMEWFYTNKMSGYRDADAILIAGDICNDVYNQINFLRFIGTKYRDVYCTFGNHDMTVVGHTFGLGNPYATSEERMKAVADAFAGTNVHILEGFAANGIFGCMGMCDLSYIPALTSRPWVKSSWKKWYDGRAWRLMAGPDGYSMDPDAIYAHYAGMLDSACTGGHRVIMTHFCPIQMGVAREYDGVMTTAYFYFDATRYMDRLAEETWWVCGHTHDAHSTTYTNPAGVPVHILCNPSGYPNESPMWLNGLGPGDFVIDI